MEGRRKAGGLVRLFEAWKRALDATIEVSDGEPAINALAHIERGLRNSFELGLCLSVKAQGGWNRRDLVRIPLYSMPMFPSQDILLPNRPFKFYS